MRKRAKAAAIAARQVRVAEMLKARHSYREMAGVLDVSLGCIAKDVKAIFKQWSARQFENVNEQALADLALLDDAIRGLAPGIQKGDANAITTFVKVLERRAKMLGYDAPGKIQVSGDAENPIRLEQLIDVRKLSDDELRVLDGILAKSPRTEFRL
jgi:hypothetical protein